MNNKLKNELVNRNIMTGEFSFMSNQEAMKKIESIVKDKEFFESLAINDKHEIIELLLERTEKISDQEFFLMLIKFAYPLDDKLINKMLDKTSDDFEISDRLFLRKLGGNRINSIDPSDDNFLARYGFSIQTMSRIFEKISFNSEKPGACKPWHLYDLMEGTLKKGNISKKDIENVFNILIKSGIEFDGFDAIEYFSNFWQLCAVFRSLCERLNEQEKNPNYINLIYKKIADYAFEKLSFGDKELQEKKLRQAFSGLLKEAQNWSIKFECSPLGSINYNNTGYEVKADNSLAYVFLWGLSRYLNENANGKILFDELIKFVNDKKEEPDFGHVFLMVICLDTFVSNNYKVDRETLKNLCESIFIKFFLSSGTKLEPWCGYSAYSRAILDRLKKLSDESFNFEEVIGDVINKAQKNNSIGISMELKKTSNNELYISYNGEDSKNVWFDRLDNYCNQVRGLQDQMKNLDEEEIKAKTAEEQRVANILKKYKKDFNPAAILAEIEEVRFSKTLKKVLKFFEPVSDDLLNKIINGIGKNISIDDEIILHLSCEGAIDKNGLSQKTILRTLKKADISSISVELLGYFIMCMAKPSANDKETTNDIINYLYKSKLNFLDANKFFIDVYSLNAIVYDLITISNKNVSLEKDIFPLYRLMNKKLFDSCIGKNKKSVEDKLGFICKSLFCRGVCAAGYPDRANPTGTWDYTIIGPDVNKIDARNSLVYVFLCDLKNMDINGIDVETKNKLLVDGLVSFIEKVYLNADASYLLASAFEILSTKDYNFKLDEEAFRKLCKLIFVERPNKCSCITENPGACAGLLKQILVGLKKIGEASGLDVKNILKQTEVWAKNNSKVPIKFVESVDVDYFSYCGAQPTYVYSNRLEIYRGRCREQFEKYEAFSKTELKKEQEQKEKEEKNIIDKRAQISNEIEKAEEIKSDFDYYEEVEVCGGSNCRHCHNFIDSTEESDNVPEPEEKIETEIKPIENKMTIDKISKKAEWLLEMLINGKNVNEEAAVNYICNGILMIPNNVLSGELKNEYCNCFRKALELPNALETIIIYLTGFLFFLKGKFKEGQLCFNNPNEAKKRFGLEDGLKKLNKTKTKIKANGIKPKFNLTENRNEIRILE